MTSFVEADTLSFNSLKNELSRTTRSTLKADLLAGLQIALLSLPQAIAYALIAGLPVSSGIFASMLSPLIFLLFSSSRTFITGPVNTIAIMIQMSISDILFTSFRDILPQEREMLALQLVIQLSMMIGILQIFISLFKLGRLTQFVSHAVVLGYLAGSFFTIVVNQLYPFLGITADPTAYSLMEKLWDIASRAGEFNTATLTVGALSFFSILVLKTTHKRVPASLITIMAATGALYFFNWIRFPYFENVMLVGAFSDFTLAPSLYLPTLDFKIINQLLPITFAITLFSMLETACTAKTVVAKTKEPIAMNQEILATGFSNLFSSFIGAMPISVSPVRSQMNADFHSKTRLSALFNSLFILLFVSIFAFFVNKIPIPALSALIIITAFSLINIPQCLVCLKATKADRLVLVLTFLSCLFFSLDVAFYIGITLSITTYLRKAALPQVVEYTVLDTGELRPLLQVEKRPIRIIKVDGELFFASAEVFENTLKTIMEDDDTTRAIILQVKNARDIDATTCLTLLELHSSLNNRNCRLILAGVTPSLWDVLSYSGVVDRMGKENLFLFDEKYPHRHLQRALARAKGYSL